MQKLIKGSKKTYYSRTILNGLLFYVGLTFLDTLWYLIYIKFPFWYITLLFGLCGYGVIQIMWLDLFYGWHYSLDFKFPCKQKVIFDNATVIVSDNEIFMFNNKQGEKLDYLPVRKYYNIFGDYVSNRVIKE